MSTIFFGGAPVATGDDVKSDGYFTAPPKRQSPGYHVCEIPDAGRRPIGTRYNCLRCERVWSLVESHYTPKGGGSRGVGEIKGNGEWWVLIKGRKPGGLMDRWFG